MTRYSSKFSYSYRFAHFCSPACLLHMQADSAGNPLHAQRHGYVGSGRIGCSTVPCPNARAPEFCTCMLPTSLLWSSTTNRIDRRRTTTPSQALAVTTSSYSPAKLNCTCSASFPAAARSMCAERLKLNVLGGKWMPNGTKWSPNATKIAPNGTHIGSNGSPMAATLLQMEPKWD